MIDAGFALKHQEFANRWYTNSGESGPTNVENPSKLNCTDRGLPVSQSCNLIDDNHDGIVDNETGSTSLQNPSQLNCTDQGLPIDKSCNLVDDDNNGFIDDVRGWDFANNDRSVQAGQTSPNGSGTHHGTYTTGVAAATGNNGVGIAGVDWGTTILPIQALDDSGSGSTISVANAIDYAVARHANVISMSLGSSADDPLVHHPLIELSQLVSWWLLPLVMTAATACSTPPIILKLYRSVHSTRPPDNPPHSAHMVVT